MIYMVFFIYNYLNMIIFMADVKKNSNISFARSNKSS